MTQQEALGIGLLLLAEYVPTAPLPLDRVTVEVAWPSDHHEYRLRTIVNGKPLVARYYVTPMRVGERAPEWPPDEAREVFIQLVGALDQLLREHALQGAVPR